MHRKHEYFEDLAKQYDCFTAFLADVSRTRFQRLNFCQVYILNTLIHLIFAQLQISRILFSRIQFSRTQISRTFIFRAALQGYIENQGFIHDLMLSFIDIMLQERIVKTTNGNVTVMNDDLMFFFVVVVKEKFIKAKKCVSLYFLFFQFRAI